MEPYRNESLVTKYAALIKENKEKRKARGEWHENEPEELIFDSSIEDDTFDDGSKVDYPWQHTNLLSIFCVQDIFGDDYSSVFRLLNVRPVKNVIFKDINGEQVIYYREEDVCRAIDVLSTLAKSNFINVLRPSYHCVKEGEPVYSSQDVMNLLDIKEERLRKFREGGYLGYTKYPGSDKIWYTQKDIQAFLNHPSARHDPWR